MEHGARIRNQSNGHGHVTDNVTWPKAQDHDHETVEVYYLDNSTNCSNGTGTTFYRLLSLPQQTVQKGKKTSKIFRVVTTPIK